MAVFTTLAIVFILVYESSFFFEHVPIKDFLTDTMWTPLFADARYGIMPLVSGTLTVTFVALPVAIPLGTIIAIYLSEFAPHRMRETVKPILELLGAVPTVVYGYFALLMVTPVLQKIIPGLPGFNMLSAGPGHRPDDRSVRRVGQRGRHARRAALHARGLATRWAPRRLQTALRVVVPGAFSGIAAAYILGISRAIGETMVVAIAAGMQPHADLQPDGAGRHHHGVHRAGEPRRPAARQHRLPEHLRRGPGADADDAGVQRRSGFFLTRRFREAY